MSSDGSPLEGMELVPAFAIGKRTSAFLSVRVPARCHPDADDYWDGNWVHGRVELAAGGFRGSFGCYLRTTDFHPFRTQLAQLHEALEGTARFATMEEQLVIDVSGDGRGHFEARCTAVDQAGVGSRLRFSLEFDQTEIPAILRDLDSIVAAYPTKSGGAAHDK